MANYNNMTNKPTINNVQLKGAKQFADYGINPIMYDAENDNLYTIVDGVEVVIKAHATSPLPEGYSPGSYIQITTATSFIALPLSGEIDYIVKMTFDNPAAKQVIGYALQANAYFGINIAGKIAAEWSINDENTHGIDDVDPTDVNVIHVEFRNGQRVKLTIEGSEQVSLGYMHETRTYGQYSLFYMNDANGSGVHFDAKIYHAMAKNTSGITLIDLYPCSRDSDSAVGFYDIVGDTFYQVSGELH